LGYNYLKVLCGELARTSMHHSISSYFYEVIVSLHEGSGDRSGLSKLNAPRHFNRFEIIARRSAWALSLNCEVVAALQVSRACGLCASSQVTKNKCADVLSSEHVVAAS
jgi:hypothetical protein